MAEYSVRVVYDADLLKRGVGAFVRYRVSRGIGWVALLAVLLLAAAFVAAPDVKWVQYALCAVLVVIALLVTASYFANLHIKLSRFRQMGDPAVALTLREDGFIVSSALGASEQPWAFLTGILKKPDFWLLFGPKATFIVMPVAGVSQEALSFLEQKIMVKKHVAS